MNKTIDVLENKRQSIANSLFELDSLKIRAVTLDSIMDDISGNDYEQINRQIIFLKEKMDVVFDNEKSRNYFNYIQSTLVMLKKCQGNKKVAESFYQEYKSVWQEIKVLFQKEFKSLKKKIESIKENDLLLLKDQIDELLVVITNNIKCSKEYLKKAYQILDSLNIDKREIVLCLEALNNESENRTSLNISDVLNTSIPILSINLENLNYKEVSQVKLLLSTYQSINLIKENIDLENNIEGIINSNSFSVNETLLRYILNDIKKLYDTERDCLTDQDFYFDDETQKEIFDNCQAFYALYQKINTIRLNLKPNKEVTKKNNILFLMTNRESYFERDLKGFNEEYLRASLELLDDFVDNSELIVNKSLIKYNNGIREIKYDKLNNKIRIIIKPIKQKVIVLGIFVKFDYGADNFYDRIAGRFKNIGDNLESYESIYFKIQNYVKEHERIGTRK